MKTISSTQASKTFGEFIESVQRGPVMITKQDRPVAVTLSIHDANRLFGDRIIAGVTQGLEDVEAGRVTEMGGDHLEALRERFKALRK